MAIVNSYKDKFIGLDRPSVYDIFQKVGTSEYKNNKITTSDGTQIHEYEAIDIAEVKIEGNRFRNYGAYSFIWEKTFVKSPERSSNGSLGNLNSYATFLTPHLILDFSVMSIDDYRKIMLLHYGANEFTVECYDPIYNRKIRVKMYFATEESAKLYTISQKRLISRQWEEWVDLVAVTEYKVELIGTNNDLDLISVKYEYSTLNEDGTLLYPYFPNGTVASPQYEEDVYLGEEIIIGENSTFTDTPPSTTLKFKHWVDDNGVIYTNGIVVTVNAPLTLYAVWESSTTFTLSFNYGISDVATEVDSSTGISTQILDREVQQGQSIGNLPPITASPFVTGTDNVKYYPYTNGGWYKYPVKQADMQVLSNSLYWENRDTIIYALYDKKPFTVSYVTNSTNNNIPTQTLYYGDKVYLPTLVRDGYSFQGWYVDSEFKSAFSGTMPPYSIILYAMWDTTL